MKATVKVGIEAQSPLGRGCRVEFSGLQIASGAPDDLRKGR